MEIYNLTIYKKNGKKLGTLVFDEAYQVDKFYERMLNNEIKFIKVGNFIFNKDDISYTELKVKNGK